MIFTVDATKNWQATGVQVPQDWQVTITYVSGSWVFNSAEPACDASGNAGLIAKGDYPLPGAPEGALIGCLGNPVDLNDQDDHIFLVGKEIVELNTAEGEVELYLIINDDITQEYGLLLDDNSGSIEVDIKVEE